MIATTALIADSTEQCMIDFSIFLVLLGENGREVFRCYLRAYERTRSDPAATVQSASHTEESPIGIASVGLCHFAARRCDGMLCLGRAA